MKRLWLAGLLAASCATSGFSGGEHLIVPLPLPVSTDGEWIAMQKTQENLDSTHWTTTGEAEAFNMNTLKGRRVSARSWYDRPNDQCSERTQAIVDASPHFDYETITWSEKCKRVEDGVTIWLLFRALTGRDSFYLVSKVWQLEPADADQKIWREYFTRISICDTRRSEAPCGEGWERAEEPPARW